MPQVSPIPRESWRTRFYRYLQERSGRSAKQSLAYLAREGCPEDKLVRLLNIAVAMDTRLPRTLKGALLPFGLTQRRINTRVGQLREIAGLMERIDQRDLLGSRYFGSFPSILRKAAALLETWRPTNLNASEWLHPLLVAHFVRLATHKAHYRNVASVLDAAYGVSDTRPPGGPDNLAKNYRRYRNVLSGPEFESLSRP